MAEDSVGPRAHGAWSLASAAPDLVPSNSFGDCRPGVRWLEWTQAAILPSSACVLSQPINVQPSSRDKQALIDFVFQPSQCILGFSLRMGIVADSFPESLLQTEVSDSITRQLNITSLDGVL
ncbi:hypothetical protein OPV22_026741 [Ensete ventricosum]|uniref:Uncharacterized protein n=1 Tax=Ensete ventricosum TaxID=4639 RepID=A0AAV8PY16_ENSVE|nr:hypothetical protein OPV22_026741 [Ensete ventricosum]